MSEQTVHYILVAGFWLYLIYSLVTGRVAVKSYIRKDRRLRREREPFGYWAYIVLMGSVISLWTVALTL